MNYYETLYIIHPALDAGRVKEIVLSVNQTLESVGGNVLAIDVWGKKKLAYEIDKQKYGTYILVQFTGDGSGNAKFNVELEHNPNILAYLTLKIEEHKILTQPQSLDEQITGTSPSTDRKSSADVADKTPPAEETESVKEDVKVSKEEASDDIEDTTTEPESTEDASAENATDDDSSNEDENTNEEKAEE